MLRSILALGASASLFVATAAAAQEPARGFGQKGELVLSAERFVPLFAYNVTKTSTTNNGNTTSDSLTTTHISLLPSFNATDNSGAGNFYNIPRVAFDYTVINGLTLGGSIYGGFTPGASVEFKRNGQSVSQDSATSTLFGVSGRVGYILGLGNAFAFWPRGGISYASISTKSPDVVVPANSSTTSANQWGLNVEAPFAWVPAQHFFIYLGPVLDIPLAGTFKTETTVNGLTTTNSQDLSQFHFGITAGLGGYINL